MQNHFWWAWLLERDQDSPRCGSRPPWLSPSHDLVLWTDGSVPFSFGKDGSGVLANCSLCGTEATLSFSAGPVCSSFSAEACAILHACCWSRPHQQVCHFSSRHPVLSLIFPLISNSVADLAGTVFSLLFYQATMDPRTLISTGKRRGWWAGQTGSAICALRNPLYSLSSYLSYPLSSYLGLEAYCLIEILWHTGSLDFHRGTCASSSCLLCPLSSTLQRTQPSFRFLSL